MNLVGGCCGTNVPHIAAANQMLRKLAPAGSHRPNPKGRTVHWVPSVASLYSQVTLRQENAFFAIGERCNANGSKKWRELQEKNDWDGCVEMAREQVKEGSHTLDVCTAFVGRDEVAEMQAVVQRFSGSVTAPLVIDSTEYIVLEKALALYGGKAIINSINFEDGEEPARKRLALAKKFGAAVIALTIDEEGMAKTPERKLAVAKRLYDMAVNEYGLKPHDLLFDPDPAVHLPAGVAWTTWEAATSTLQFSQALVDEFSDPSFALAFARIENHYFVNGGWFTEGQLIAGADRIRHIPGVIVQGAYDLPCPVVTADDLHRAWPEADYRVVLAGHSASEPAIAAELVAATDRFAG